MSGSHDQELGELLAALCDDRLGPGQAARLEQLASRSVESRRFFLEYLQLHGELYWDYAVSTAAARSEEAIPVPPYAHEQPRTPAPTSQLRTRRLLLLLTALAATILVVIVGWWTVPPKGGDDPEAARPRIPAETVAELTGVADAVWEDSAAPANQASLAAGRTLRLREGLAEIHFKGGAEVVLEGPAVFGLTSESAGHLDSGRLVAVVSTPAAGFSVQTPNSLIVDRGTEFGVSVEPDGQSEVHVFVGAVDVWPTAHGAQARRLIGGQAIRLSFPAGDAASVAEIALAEQSFSRRLHPAVSPDHSVAALRDMAQKTPSLLHHYTFEGATREEKCRDSRGDLNLAEVIMADGRGGGNVDYSAQGFDSSTTALQPFRAVKSGNTNGASLQSEGQFHPPNDMTIELLLNFDGVVRSEPGAIAAAIATRRDEQDCGFFVAVVSDGEMVCLLDADSAWCESDLVLQPGLWYYVAATFHATGERTTVNLYAANLSRGEHALGHVAKDKQIAGVPAASRLGIGKAFDWSTAHAYPWSGALDEVAIYGEVLSRRALQSHLEAIVGPTDLRNDEQQ